MSGLTYYKVPHPLREGELILYDPDDVRQALEDARRGAPLVREARGAGSPPDEAEVRAVEARLRRWLNERSRVAWGRALWWASLGPALSLLWINFAEAVALLFAWLPPLAVLIATLGAVTGGPLLATLVALLPLIWAWRRAWRHVGEGRAWGRLARLAGGRRFRTAPLQRVGDQPLEAFTSQGAPLVAALRSAAGQLGERGADGAAEVARLMRELYQLAARHGLAGAAGVYHGIYRRFDAAERRVASAERAGGVLAERRVAKELTRARQEVGRGLARHLAQGRAPFRLTSLAPLAGLLGGLLTLVLVLWLTGVYFVEPGQAVIVDPPGARLARLPALFGLRGAGQEGQGGAGGSGPVEVVRSEGYHWGWPRPFSDRHAISLGEQRARLRAILRQTGPDRYDVVLVEVRFRISDVDRWARLDRDGNGVAILSARLSDVLQRVLVQQQQEAAQALRQQNPALADDPAQLAARASQLVEGRLEEIVRAFAGALSESGATAEAGVQLSREVQSTLVRGVPGELAGAGTQ
jgi:hypothetical protein